MLFFKKLEAGIGGRREEPRALPLYYQSPKGRGTERNPITFKSLRAVGIDKPRLEEGGVRRIGNPEPEVRMEANALGGGRGRAGVRTFLRGPGST